MPIMKKLSYYCLTPAITCCKLYKKQQPPRQTMITKETSFSKNNLIFVTAITLATMLPIVYLTPSLLSPLGALYFIALFALTMPNSGDLHYSYSRLVTLVVYHVLTTYFMLTSPPLFYGIYTFMLLNNHVINLYRCVIHPSLSSIGITQKSVGPALYLPSTLGVKVLLSASYAMQIKALIPTPALSFTQNNLAFCIIAAKGADKALRYCFSKG